MCNESGRSIAPIGNIILFKKCHRECEPLATLYLTCLICPRLEPRTSRSKDERVTARPTGLSIWSCPALSSGWEHGATKLLLHITQTGLENPGEKRGHYHTTEIVDWPLPLKLAITTPLKLAITTPLKKEAITTPLKLLAPITTQVTTADGYSVVASYE